MESGVRIGWRLAVLVLVCAAVAGLLLAGCAKKTESTTVTPKVTPPAVKQEGVLRAGIDLSWPPYGGVDGDKQAGLDIDVASAIADELGLKLVVVDVKASEAATALADGRVDAIFSAKMSQTDVGRVTIAVSYLSDGPALFTAEENSLSVEASQTPDAWASSLRIGAQEGSPSYWRLSNYLGTGSVTSYPTLREALEALKGGELDAVGGDAIIGTYIARDLGGIRFAGQLEYAELLGIGVDPQNTDLANAIREAVDTIRANGVLTAARHKWVGDLPALVLPQESAGAESSAEE
ncbi:MAG: substrate-binding periplasmic protein [Coriobacteriia bacterium]